MELDLFQVDAFTDRPFAGNPAAVVPLAEWLPDAQLAAIAAENNLSETAFFLRGCDPVPLRWFTPAAEVELCGHATLATAHVLLTELAPDQTEARFETRWSGPLVVRRATSGYRMDFPALPAEPSDPPAGLAHAIGVSPEAALVGHKWLAVLADEAAVRAVRPDMAALARLDCQGVIVTAPGDAVDFVSRFFAPRVGVPEDPVTGSAHCVLTPYWSARLNRGDRPMTARQVSARGGDVGCRLVEDRVELTGAAVTVIRGKLRF